jgi:cell division protein FtsB
MTHNRNLIILLGILLAARFILVPIFEWQTQSLSSTQRLQDKLDKSIAYIDELPKLDKYQQDLLAEVKKRQAAREYVSDISRYQLDKFRQFESLMQKHKLAITSSNWGDPIKTAKGVALQLRMQFSGTMKDFIAFHLALDSLSNTLSLNNLNLTLNDQSEDKLGSFTGNINVQFLPLERNDEDN